MNPNFWSGDSANALVAKAVVSGSGHAVAKNYDRNGLRPGDLGLEMRLDRGKIEEMTPEQRQAAQAIANEMQAQLLSALGVERAVTRFNVGDIVSFSQSKIYDRPTAHVLEERDSMLWVETLGHHNDTWVRASVPIKEQTVVVNDYPYRGRKGVLYLYANGPGRLASLEDYGDDQHFLAVLLTRCGDAYAQPQRQLMELLTDDRERAFAIRGLARRCGRLAEDIAMAQLKNWGEVVSKNNGYLGNWQRCLTELITQVTDPELQASLQNDPKVQPWLTPPASS